MSEYTDKAREIRAAMDIAGQAIDDDTALKATALYPEWSGDGVTYEVGNRLTYNGILLYKVLQEHTSQPDWTPDIAPSLFARVLADGDIREWEQPDSTNPYMKGDRVTHNGKIWESDIDTNVWEPGVYGWSEV